MINSDNTLARWVSDLRSGDKYAFEQIYFHFQAKLYQFAFKLTRDQEEAEEVVQEVFVRLWESRQLIDTSKNFDGYLFLITRNIVYNHARHQAYKVAYLKYLDADGAPLRNVTEERLNFEELRQVLEEIYSALSPVRKQVFIMSRIEGLSNSEIAAILHTSTSNIENHIYKALLTIRQKFDKYRILYTIEAPVLILVKVLNSWNE
ncbi:RNA polymerase sigma-70 factor [Nibrella viscosa]|uniref:RNA polymerase sigma-70 factor n=1 Tax=Nibrella viscosa TaxID=1084524 RepID=A0ABP8KPW8_9BACT